MSKKFSPKYIIPTYEISKNDFSIVGTKGIDEYRLIKSGVGTLDGFAVTTEAFDEFLHDSKILELLADNDKLNHEELSKQIKSVILETPIRGGLLINLHHEFNIINRLGKVHHLELIPSFYTAKPVLLDAMKDRQIIVSNVDELIIEIKGLWADLFSKELLDSRTSLQDFDISSLAVLVLRMPEFEVSGKVSIDNTNKQFIIQAEFGDLDKDLFYADEYLVDMEMESILEKKVNLQDRMLVRKKNELVSIAVSKAWQGKQKISDTKIRQFIKPASDVIKSFRKDLSLEFGIHKGKIILFDLHYTGLNLYKEKSKEIWQNENGIAFEKDIVEATFAEELAEISASIPAYPEKQPPKKVSKGLSLITRLRALEKKSFTKEYLKVVDIYLDTSVSRTEIYEIMKKYSGIYTDMSIFYDYTKSPLSLSDYFDLFKKYTMDLSGIAFQNSENPFLLKLIDYDPITMTPVDYTEIITTQLLVLKKLLVEYSHKNIHLVLPSVATVEDLLFFFKIFNALDFSKLKAQSDIYVSINSPSFLYEINRFDFKQKNLLDGIFLDLDVLMRRFFLKDNFRDRDYKLIYELLEKAVRDAKNPNIKFIIKLNKANKSRITELLELKPDAVVVDFVD